MKYIKTGNSSKPEHKKDLMFLGQEALNEVNNIIAVLRGRL